MRNSAISAVVAVMLAAAATAQTIAPLPARPARGFDGPVHATPSAGTLTLDQVLASSRQHAPQILEAFARVRAAEGRRLSVDGAFDTLFSADGFSRLTGFSGGTVGEAKVLQPLQSNGGNIYGGYRASRGRFPIYEDESYTNELGELKAGAVFALMRDRLIDERRFNRTVAENEIALADAERLMIAIGIQARAVEAYNAWAIAGQRLAIYKQLYALAAERQRGFERQVTAGFRPRILLVENEQNILRRQTLVAQAEQALARAANTLSLFWRDADGRPVVPAEAQLPDRLPQPFAVPLDPRSGAVQRPDLRTIDLRLDLVRQRLALDRNNLLPRLDVAVELARDFGDPGAGGVSRNGTDTKVGLTFRLPFQNRAARGRWLQTQAEIEALERRGQALGEQIVNQIDAIGIDIGATRRLAELAAAERERAETMAAAERRRFEAGASDFFLVNLREEAAADAAVRQVDAEARRIVATVDLLAATADTGSLGLN
jgi:outer membrane protein TolC